MAPKTLPKAAEIGSGDENRGAGPMANFTCCSGKAWQFVTEICYEGKQGLKHSSERKKKVYIYKKLKSCQENNGLRYSIDFPVH